MRNPPCAWALNASHRDRFGSANVTECNTPPGLPEAGLDSLAAASYSTASQNRRFPVRGAVTLTGLMLLAAPPALAHAILVDSTPAPNGHVAPGQLPIMLRYNSRIDARRSKVTLTAQDGVVARLPAAAGEAPQFLRSSATVRPGAYTLRWQVLAVDGHITRGSVPFTVDAK